MNGFMEGVKRRAYIIWTIIWNFINEKATRTFCWLSLIIFLSLIQIVILVVTLYMRNANSQMDQLIKGIIKDGVLFFFATALVGSTLFDLLDTKRFPARGLESVACILVPSAVIFITIITYPSVILDLCLEIPEKLEIDYTKLRFAEIVVTVLAILYSLWIKLIKIPESPNNLSRGLFIKEE